MKKLIMSALLAFSFLIGHTPVGATRVEYAIAPIDPGALSVTKNLYIYLATRRDAPSNSMIAGQFLGMINQVWYPGQSFFGHFDYYQHAIDGKLPGMAGSRYDGDDKKTGNYVLNQRICRDVNLKLIAIWQETQPIIHLTATPPNPWNRAKGRFPEQPDKQQLSKLLRAAKNLTPDEETIRDQFWADIDIIAAGLQELEDKGIPVVFRPFAEFNVNKYYFLKQSPEDFNALWKEVYHHYVDDTSPGKGLHNLLFCWEVWALNRNPSSGNIAPWYPGANYVDIVAGAFYFRPEIDYFDEVTNRFSFDEADPQDKAIYNWLVSQNKPFGASQFGLNQDTKVPGDHNFTLTFMDYVDDAGDTNPMAFALYWNQYQSVERQASGSQFVAEARIATVDDLPNFTSPSSPSISLSKVKPSRAQQALR